MANKDLRTLSKYQLILARDQFRKNPPQHIKAQTLHTSFLLIIQAFSVIMSLLKDFTFKACILLILAALIDNLELQFSFFNSA